MFPAKVSPEASKNNGFRTPASAQKALDVVCTEAEISKHLTPHSMRRTFNNLMRREGVDRVALRAMIGHSSEGMTEHYSDVGIEEKKTAVSSLMQRLVAVGYGSDGANVDQKVDRTPSDPPFRAEIRTVGWDPEMKKPR